MMRAMVRIALCCCLALLGCKDKDRNKASGTPAAPAGSGSAPAASAAKPVAPPAGSASALRWTDPEGELMLAMGDGNKLEGACGLTGTVTATEVELGGQKETWSRLLREGRKFSLPRLDWVIEVSPTGDVVHKRGGTETPLGKVTGVETEAGLAWFGALVVAAPMIQHRVTLTSMDGTNEVTLSGAADLRAWAVTDKAGARISTRNRDDAAPVLLATRPAHDPSKITVEPTEPGMYRVSVADDPTTRAVLASPTYLVREMPDGQLTWVAEGTATKSVPFAKLGGRKACKAHDRAVPALVWSFLATETGVKAATATK